MGKFGKENFDEGNHWRVYCKTTLVKYEGIQYDLFNFKTEPPEYATQREVMNLDLHKLRTSDLVIVNFNDMWSLGTMAELAIAHEKRIPIIGFDKDKQELHPW